MTDSAGIAPEVRSFLREYIVSYEQLEVLLCLRDDPGKEWSCLVLAEKLGRGSNPIDEALKQLAASKLLVTRRAEGRVVYGYGPEDPELAHCVTKLAAAYGSTPLEVMRLMNDNAIARMRTGAARAFADAFLLGSGRKKDG